MDRRAACGVVGWLFLLLMLGCRTTQPDLKPRKEPEALVAPPDEARFAYPSYPKQAFAKDDDPTKRWGPTGPGGAGGGRMGGPGMSGPNPAQLAGPGAGAASGQSLGINQP